MMKVTTSYISNYPKWDIHTMKYSIYVVRLILDYQFQVQLPKMMQLCIDCSSDVPVPNDSIDGEIISCPDCGLDYIITLKDDGSKTLKELTIVGEDWGE